MKLKTKLKSFYRHISRHCVPFTQRQLLATIKEYRMRMRAENLLAAHILQHAPIADTELQRRIDEAYATERAYAELDNKIKASFYCGSRTALMTIKLLVYPDQKGRAYPYNEAEMRKSIDANKEKLERLNNHEQD